MDKNKKYISWQRKSQRKKAEKAEKSRKKAENI